MKFTQRNSKLEIVIHVLAWCVVFCAPFVFMPSGNHAPRPDHSLGYIIYVSVFFATFYINYLYLIDKLLFDRKTIKFIVINIIFIGVCTYLLHEFQHHEFPHNLKPEHMPGPPPPIFILRDMTSLIFSVGLSVALRMTGKWYTTENERKEVEKDRYETELKNLKNQLNPHFLFNTLNNIYSLIPVQPEQAQETVHRLSQLLRYVLYENNDNFVPLEKEINFLKSYIELMSLRLSDQVTLTTDFQVEAGNDRIAPMLFISLVENAFKHGTSPTHPSFIRISLASTEGKEVICTVENSNFPKNIQDKSGSGIGQENLRKRLELLYPQHHKLTLENRENSYFAQLTIRFVD